MPKLNVRPAACADFPKVAALLTELGRPALTPETAEAARAVYERHIADPSTASLVAEADGSVIGFLSLVFREHLNYIHPQGWIPDLIVTEPARGWGRPAHFWRRLSRRPRGTAATGSGLSRATRASPPIRSMGRSA